MVPALPISVQLWLILIIPMALVIGLIIWVTRRDATRLDQQRKMSATMLSGLQEANAKLGAAVAREKGAILSVTMLPVNVHPLEAELALRAALPDASDADKHILMLSAWKSEQSQQALAALAGMALADTRPTGGVLLTGISTAISHAEPGLLRQIAEAIDAAPATSWVARDLALNLEIAAERIEDADPETARFVAGVSRRLVPALRESMMRMLRIEFEEWEDQGDLQPLPMVRELVKYCHPRFPELLAAMHEIMGRYRGSEWELAPVQLDEAMLEYWQLEWARKYLDLEAVGLRLEAAITSPHAAVAQGAARILASLLQDYYFDSDDYQTRFQHALDWAVAEHGLAQEFEELERQLNPREVTEAKLREAKQNMQLYMKMRSGTAALGETTSTIDPGVALMELRQVMPDVPADMLRTVLVERLKEDRSVLWLAALGGLALEAVEEGPEGDNLVRLCLHWPLKAGPPELVASLAGHLERRFDRLDGWIEREASVLELRKTAARLEAEAPEVAARVAALLERVEARRVDLLERAIRDRLARDKDEDRFATQLALDMRTLCVPGEPRLAGPVRDYMLARRARPMWRSALIEFETMTVMHFGAQGQLARYDFDFLLSRIIEGMEDDEGDVAWTSWTSAARLVEAKYLSRPIDRFGLGERVKWAENRYDPLPESHARLRDALRATAF